LVGFLLSREDQLPILASLDGHLAKESFIALELSTHYLSEEEYLWDEVCFVFDIFDVRNGCKFWWHDLKYNSKLISESTTSFGYRFFHPFTLSPNIRPLLFLLFQMNILSEYVLVLLYFGSNIMQ
jgi:hypothetical protein